MPAMLYLFALSLACIVWRKAICSSHGAFAMVSACSSVQSSANGTMSVSEANAGIADVDKVMFPVDVCVPVLLDVKLNMVWMSGCAHRVVGF